MSATIRGHEPGHSIEEKVREIYEEIKRTGKVTIDGKTYHVNKVTVFENSGVISGWNITFKVLSGKYTYDVIDREDISYLRIRMRSPGIIVGVGEDFYENRAVIIYSK